MPDSSARERTLAADASWLVLAKTVAFGVTFLLPLVLVRQLSQEQFGLYRQLFLLVNTAINILPFGFAMSAFYFMPRVGDARRAVAVNILAVYAAVAAIAGGVIAFRPSVLSAIFDDPGLAAYAPLVAAVLFLSVISSFVDVLALANGDVKSAATFVIVTNVVKTILLASAAIRFASVQAILAASIIHGVFQLLFLFGYLKRGFGSILAHVDGRILRQQLAYALPLGLAAWLYWLQMESHHYFVARSFGAATYAIYAIGCVTLPLTAVFGESMSSVMIQRVNLLHSQKRRDDIVLLLGQAFRHLAFFYLPLYALLLVIGRDLIALVYTQRFIASWPIFAINLILMPLSILGVVSDAVIRSYNETRLYLSVRMVLVPMLLAALWFLTPRYGPIAAISAVVGISVLERLIVAGRTAAVLELTWGDAAHFKGVIGIGVSALLAGMVTGVAHAVFADLPRAVLLLICVAVFTAVYLAAYVAGLLANGQPVDWPAAITNFIARRARPSDAPGSKAA